MIKDSLVHPQIFETPAASGHFSRVLVSDGIFAADVVNPAGRNVLLNLSSGIAFRRLPREDFYAAIRFLHRRCPF